MKRFLFNKVAVCLIAISLLSIGSVSAKMFGHTCSFTIEYTVTAWYFWIPDISKFDTECGHGNPVDVCNAFGELVPAPVE